MKSFEEIAKLNRELVEKFKEQEQRPWGAEASLIELTKQVGTLSKHIMVYEKYYVAGIENKQGYKTDLSNIANQLADIFYCLVRLADHYKIDLEKSILDMIDDANEKLK
jgi:NTP pyrophosphatase (non-canonical NTP hydrolase)